MLCEDVFAYTSLNVYSLASPHAARTSHRDPVAHGHTGVRVRECRARFKI